MRDHSALSVFAVDEFFCCDVEKNLKNVGKINGEIF